MAYWRSLSARATNTARRHHHHQPSIAHFLHDDDDDRRNHHDAVSDHATSPPILNHLLAQKRFTGSGSSRASGLGGFSNATLSDSRRFSGVRYMSTAIGGGSDKAELLSDASGVLSDTSIEALASNVPAMSEVAIAAADSYLPVKALQYVIDFVHVSTGLNWWAAIAITTLLIRSATIPFLINQVKVTSKMSLIKPQLDDIKQEMQDAGMSPVAVAEGNRKTQKLFKEYGLHPLSPLKGLFISAPVFISFFLAISNMAEKVPSFKTGGAYWFVDLSTPDSMYIFPSLAALTFLITVECNMLEGVDANSAGKTMKNISRAFAVLTIPFTMSFPKALFCYWITSNLFSLGYGLVLKSPGVRSSLGIPQLPPPSTAQSQRPPQPPFSMFSALKQVAASAKAEHSSHAEPPKVSDGRMSSSSVLSQRIKTLEKQVKGRKRNKKR